MVIKFRYLIPVELFLPSCSNVGGTCEAPWALEGSPGCRVLLFRHDDGLFSGPGKEANPVLHQPQ